MKDFLKKCMSGADECPVRKRLMKMKNFFSIRKLPGDMKLRDPAVLLATWFGSGLIKPASGTWGTIASLPFAVVIYWLGGAMALAVCMVLALFVGVWAANSYEKQSGEHDASAIVIDEVHGMWLALIPVADDPLLWAMAFGLFRLFDVLKPWPVSYFDQEVEGGWGVMLDDSVAGIYTMLVLFVFMFAIYSQGPIPLEF